MSHFSAFKLGALADPNAPEYRAPCNLLGFSAEEALTFLRAMCTIRMVEEKIAEWIESGTARCPCHLSIGQEAIAVGIAHALRPSDRLFGNHRSHAHYLAVGGEPFGLFAEVLGRESGCSKGMGGSMHLHRREMGFFGSVPIVAGTIPVAVGAALAAKMDGKDSIAVAYFGDGAAEEGVLHESLNLAAIYQLPILFVCENNQYSSHLDIALRQPADRVSRYADAHCVRSALVDGNDVTLVAKITTELVAEMRRDRIPVFLEAITYRWRGHVGPKEDIDVGVRRSMQDLQAWKQRDPVRRLEDAVLSQGWVNGADLAELHCAVGKNVAAAATEALAAPWPAPNALLDLVYAD